MAQNFVSCDHDQPMLPPPDLRDWLDDDHLDDDHHAWIVIDAVCELDLEPFYTSYRADGHGPPPTIRRSIAALRGERSEEGDEPQP